MLGGRRKALAPGTETALGAVTTPSNSVIRPNSASCNSIGAATRSRAPGSPTSGAVARPGAPCHTDRGSQIPVLRPTCRALPAGPPRTAACHTATRPQQSASGRRATARRQMSRRCRNRRARPAPVARPARQATCERMRNCAPTAAAGPEPRRSRPRRVAAARTPPDPFRSRPRGLEVRDQRGSRIIRTPPDGHWGAKAGHAVPTPLHRDSSAGRSSRSTGAADS